MTFNINNATFTSDNGREFANDEVKDCLSQFGCTQMFTAAINPTSNGIIENKISIIKRQLRALNTTEDTLEQNLEMVIYNHNSMPDGNRLNRTPFEISMGRLNLSLLAQADEPPIDNFDKIKSQMQTIQYQVAENLTNRMRSELFSIGQRQNNQFRRLDFVLILGPPKPGFMVRSNLAWHGPMIVTSLFGRAGVKVRDIYSGRSYKRNIKYVKLLNLSNALKRTIKEHLVKNKASSFDVDTLEEIISRKLQEKSEIDDELRVEIESITTPARHLEEQNTASSDSGQEYKERDENKNQPEIDENQYNLRKRRPVNYKE